LPEDSENDVDLYTEKDGTKPGAAVGVLQALWLLGVLGAVYVVSQQPDQPLPLLIAQQPWTIWFVGPAAAAVTGG
jgi:uncharacterized integral membrane protein